MRPFKAGKIFATLAGVAISVTMTTTAIAETEARPCLLGLTIAGQGINIGCLGSKKRRAAQPSIKEFCGPPLSGKPFTPLTWSKTDSQATKDEIREHNAAGRAAGCWK